MVAHARRAVDNPAPDAAGPAAAVVAAAAPVASEMNIRLLSIEREGVIRLATSGTITAHNFDPSGRNPLERILGQTWSTMRVAVDMSQTSYVDSSAVGWLIATAKAFKTGGGRVVLYDVPPGVRQMLDLLKVDRLVPLADTVAGAREALLRAE